MLYRIENNEQAILFVKWAEENAILFEELEEANYTDICPKCGDSEFWHYGHCSHCGYDLGE